MERINKWLKDNEYIAWWIAALMCVLMFLSSLLK